jgi:hypothetical protein
MDMEDNQQAALPPSPQQQTTVGRSKRKVVPLAKDSDIGKIVVPS